MARYPFSIADIDIDKTWLERAQKFPGREAWTKSWTATVDFIKLSKARKE